MDMKEQKRKTSIYLKQTYAERAEGEDQSN